MERSLKKATIAWQVAFLVLCAATGAYYLVIGQWKAYVAMFGLCEMLVVMVSAIVFAVAAKKGALRSTLLTFAVVLLCAMQLFPLVGSVVIGGVSFVAVHFALHVVILGVGVMAERAGRQY